MEALPLSCVNMQHFHHHTFYKVDVMHSTKMTWCVNVVVCCMDLLSISPVHFT